MMNKIIYKKIENIFVYFLYIKTDFQGNDYKS